MLASVSSARKIGRMPGDKPFAAGCTSRPSVLIWRLTIVEVAPGKAVEHDEIGARHWSRRWIAAFRARSRIDHAQGVPAVLAGMPSPPLRLRQSPQRSRNSDREDCTECRIHSIETSSLCEQNHGEANQLHGETHNGHPDADGQNSTAGSAGGRHLR